MTQITVTLNVPAHVVNEIRSEIEGALYAELDEFGIDLDSVSVPKKQLKSAVNDLLPSVMVQFEKEVFSEVKGAISDYGSSFIYNFIEGSTVVRRHARKIIEDGDLKVKTNKAQEKAELARAADLAAKYGMKLVKE